MKNKKREKEKQDGFLTEILSKLGGYILLEIIWNIIWNILLFIPRMVIRLMKNIW
ncbi:hypothetical protein [Lysinibacillus agricola]|uniref:hypothetical protein n=1 Tax=Lysinibacillus agricola TaxID=2590012 RepID=UPI003C2812FC